MFPQNFPASSESLCVSSNISKEQFFQVALFALRELECPRHTSYKYHTKPECICEDSGLCNFFLYITR